MLSVLLFVFCLLPGCARSVEQAAPAATSVSTETTLRQREIDLLKRRLAIASQELDKEKISRIVYQTQLEVATLRGFEVKKVVQYAPLTTEKLNEILESGIKRQYPGESMTHYVWFNRLFAALPADIDMIEYMKALTTEQVAGLYDPLSRVLYVRTGFDLESPLGRMILSHEICHAMQDQNTPLIELGVEDSTNADRAVAVLAMAEGDATLLMGEHLARYGNPFGLFAQMPKMMLMDQERLDNAPIAIQKSLLFPYLEGMSFFNRLAGRTREDPTAVDSPAWETSIVERSQWRQAIFEAPPDTTEQVLHPEKYLSRELPTPIHLPAAAFENLATSSSSVLGEFGIELTLEPMLGESRARKAAAGWDGDQILVGDPLGSDDTVTSGVHTLYWMTRWDTARDAEEFSTALHDALTTRYAGTLHWSKRLEPATAKANGAEMTIERPEAKAVLFRGTWRQLPE